MRHPSAFFDLLIAGMLLSGIATPARASDIDHLESIDEADVVEPIVTEETLPNEVGEWDLRVSTYYATNGPDATTVLPQLTLFFGIAERLGGDISVPFVYRKTDIANSYEVGPVSASLKYLVAKPDPNRLAVALGVEFELPTGDEVEFPIDGVSAEEPSRSYEITPFVGVLTTIGRATLQGNVGYSFGVPESGGATSRQLTYNWAGSVAVSAQKTWAMLELNGGIGIRDSEDSASVAPGFRHIWDERQSMAIAVPIGLNENTPAWILILQWQWSL